MSGSLCTQCGKKIVPCTRRYPIEVVPEFARITLFEHVGRDDESVIAVAPEDLPDGFPG